MKWADNDAEVTAESLRSLRGEGIPHARPTRGLCTGSSVLSPGSEGGQADLSVLAGLVHEKVPPALGKVGIVIAGCHKTLKDEATFAQCLEGINSFL